MGNDRDRQASSIRSRIRRYELQRTQLRNEVAVLNGKIERLRSAYNRVHAAKKAYKKEKEALDKIYDEHFSWQGSNYDTFRSYSSICKGANKDFLNDVDSVQDEINRAMTGFENQVLEKMGAIGRLSGWINSAWTELQNLFN